jgi:long-chain fatty acid transport protein
MDLEDTDSIGYGLRTGFQFQRGDLELGGSYFTETALDLDGGTMTLNLSALGLEKVDYDARIDGFNWPRRAGIGFGYRLNPSFLVAGDLEWIDWSSAINTLSIAMSNPDHPMAPPTRVIPFRMDWHDQWVYAMGMEMIPAPDLAIRLGYNHGDAPIPESTLRPLFPAIAEDHVTAGLGVSKRDWTFDLTLEYVLETETTNLSSDAALNPFGPGSTEQLSQFVAHLMVRKVVGADTRNR